MELSELYKFLRHPIQYITHHSKDYDRLFQENNRLSQQYINEVNKNKELTGRNQELDFQVRQLSRDLSVLNNEKTGLKAELENLAAENKTINLKNDAYRKKFIKYQDRVQNSEEFKQKKVKVDNLSMEKAKLEEKVSRLSEKISGFDVIYRQQKKVISNLHKAFETSYKEDRKKHESSLNQTAEGDEEMSYVIIGGSGRIIASTPAFREKFNFNDPKNPINRKMYFKVLQPPKDAPDYHEKGKYVYDIKQAFRDTKKVTLETTIVDGKGEEKIIQFTKHEPDFREIVKRNQFGEELNVKNYFYTKVEIYDIGKWERIKEGATIRFKKILHIKNGEPKELHEYAEKRAVQRKQNEEKEKKEYNQRMAEVYAGLIFDDPKTWNVEKFEKIEKERGIKAAEFCLRAEYEKIPETQKQKRELIGQIIAGIIRHKEK